MKLVFYEAKKIFSLKIFVICLITFFAINGLLLYYTENQDTGLLLIHNNPKQYEQLIEEFSTMKDQEASERLEHEETIGSILALLSANEENESQEDIQAQLQMYQAMNPDEFKEAAKKIKSGYNEIYYEFLNDISSQISYKNTYREFIEGMEKRAQNKLKFSAMSEDNNFSRKNIIKTPEDFQNVINVRAEVGNYKYAENSTNFQITDYFLIILIILICIALFSIEREKNLNNIIRSTKNGLLPTVIAKLFTLISFAFLISVVYLTSDILICGAYTGFGSLNANIQSSQQFMNCPFDISVLDYLAIWVLSKSVTICAISVIIALIFVVINSSVMNYVFSFVFAAIEFILYIFIPSTSYINHLKYINIFAFLWDNNVFGNYLNLNIFGEPIALSAIFIIVSGAITVLFLTFSIILYVKKIRFSAGKFTDKVLSAIGKLFSDCLNTVSIFLLESRKILFRMVTIFSIIILCYFAYNTLTDDISIRYYDPVKSCYGGYMLDLSGEITAEKKELIRTEKKFFDSINDQIEEISDSESYSKKEKEAKINTLLLTSDSKGKAFDDVFEQYQYSKNVAKKLNIKASMVDRDISSLLVNNPSRDWQLFVIMLLFIIVIMPQIFAYEYKNNSENLIRTCRHGRLNLITKKVLVAYLLDTFAYILVYLPFLLNYTNIYGSDILNTPLIFVQTFSNIGSSITIMQYLILLSTVRISILVTVTMFALAGSVLLRNSVTSMLLTTVVSIIPCVAFMNNTAVRFSGLFSCGIWSITIPIIIAFSLIIFVLGFAILVSKFGNIKLLQK